MAMEIGQTVKYAKPADEREAQVRFTLVEVNGDRCIIRLICDWRIAPTECVALSDIEPA